MLLAVVLLTGQKQTMQSASSDPLWESAAQREQQRASAQTPGADADEEGDDDEDAEEDFEEDTEPADTSPTPLTGSKKDKKAKAKKEKKTKGSTKKPTTKKGKKGGSAAAAAPVAAVPETGSSRHGGKKMVQSFKVPKHSQLAFAYVGMYGGSFGEVALGPFNRPSFVAVEPNRGDVCVSSTFAHQIQILSARGSAQPLATPHPPASTPPPAEVASQSSDTTPTAPQRAQSASSSNFFSNPQGLVVAPAGDSIYVADGGNNRVIQLALRPKAAATALPPPSGASFANTAPGSDWSSTADSAASAPLIRPTAFGGRTSPIGRLRGTAPPTFSGEPVYSAPGAYLVRPLGMALEEPLLFVASSGTGSIVALAHDTLRHAFSFGHEEGHGKLSMPMGVAVYRDASGKALVYVTDRDNDRLVAYDMDGGFVRAIGSRGRAPGQFMEPLGVAISGECIFVAEGVGARLQVLSPHGASMHVLPSPDQSRLCGIACHLDRVYVTELLAHRLHTFRFRASK